MSYNTTGFAVLHGSTVLNKVLHREALPRVLRPYHLHAFA